MKRKTRQLIDGEWYTKPKRGKPVKLTRCSGWMTESEFFSMIRASLRGLSYRWLPRQEAINKHRIEKRIGRSRYAYECQICKKYFPRKEIEVDHIKPVGTLTSTKDLPKFVDNLLVEVDGWRPLCHTCHKKVTREQRGI